MCGAVEGTQGVGPGGGLWALACPGSVAADDSPSSPALGVSPVQGQV